MSADTWFNTFALLGAWLVYFAIHSLFASLWLKQRVVTRFPDFMPAYRLSFNALALVLLLPIVWLMAAHPWPLVWQWQGAAKLVTSALAVLALLGFIWSLKYYDMQEFLGIRQWRGQVKSVADQEHLKISPLHRFVRHPWYFFALVLVWSRDMNLAQLITSVMVSLYFIIGSRMEERKLLVYYGERYRRYMQRVPGLFPLPGRVLSAREAAELGGDRLNSVRNGAEQN